MGPTGGDDGRRRRDLGKDVRSAGDSWPAAGPATSVVRAPYARDSNALINQILRPHLAKSRELSFPPFPDLPHRPPRFECRAELVPRREPIEAVIPKLELVRMHRANRPNQRDRKLRGVVARAIRDAESQTTQRGAAILAIRRRERSERGRLNLHAGHSRLVEP